MSWKRRHIVANGEGNREENLTQSAKGPPQMG